ncbi:hypothetical protein IKF74_00500 [Candidatus Saccharibacteria bacterium]|mgnify:CR=1 FL=1|nr:hypothetical protein [Candidatus Saccharibacteria bacterium]
MSVFYHSDEELFNELIDEVDAQIDAENAKKPFDFNKEIIGKIDEDASRIAHGETLTKVIKLRHTTLHNLARQPKYHSAARQYWNTYCYEVAKQVNQQKPSRHLHLNDFPSLEYAIL